MAASRVLLTNIFHVLKENPRGCDKNFVNAANFHRFHVHLFKVFSPHINDQADSDSLINTLFLHLVNQNDFLNISNDQNDTVTEQIKKEVLIVFTQTEL